LSDLRQSGSIEQDSDAVLMIYRDEYYNEDSKAKRVAEVLRRKVRKGQTGTTFLRTEFEYSRFSEIDQNQEIEQGVDYFDY
jgi:replicative DNA helicase